MNKFIKYSLITAGILAGIGIILCGISIMFGGYRNIVKVSKSAEVADVFDDVAEKTGIQISFPGRGWGLNFSSSDDVGKGNLIINGEKFTTGEAAFTFPADQIENLDISLGAGQLEIKRSTSEDNEIAVNIYGVGAWDYTIEEETLYMETMEDSCGLFWGMGPKNFLKCVIEVPKDYYPNQVKIDLGAGQVDLMDLQVNRLGLEMAAGQIRCKQIQAQNVDIDVSVGECQFQGEVLQDMKIECATGEVVTKLSGSETDYNYNLRCDVGNIKIGTSNLAGLGGSKNMDNGAARNMSIDCSTGNVEVSFER